MLVPTIKAALENVVLCRGAHSAKESYEYAEKMEATIKAAIKERLHQALERGAELEEAVCEIIEELEA
jgi:hypothetical protein